MPGAVSWMALRSSTVAPLPEIASSAVGRPARSTSARKPTCPKFTPSTGTPSGAA